tara:strand:+ start:26618 stop:27475 length:858 start_codon:yes stop_codon:yes gene_type:complete
MKILVTGSEGQLGSELKVRSQNFNCEWIFTDFNEFDIGDLSNINIKLNQYSPDIIINCAAYTNVDKAEKEPFIANLINHLAVEAISGWTHENSCDLIHISTDYVFDGNSKKKLKEISKTSPLNIYGLTKLEGEKSCILNNPNSIIIRTSWVFSSFGNNFVKSIIKLSKIKKKINVVDDQVGSPTYAGDLADIILQIIFLKKWIPGLYNFSNHGEVSWYQLALKIKQIYGFESEINPVLSSQFKTIAVRPKYSLLDKSKIKETFSLSIPNFIDSLEKCILIIKNEK